MHSRAERAAEALALRREGLVYREIGERMGVSLSYAQDLVRDPDGEKVRARKASYRGRCVDCGSPTDGSNGWRNAAARCTACFHAKQKADAFWQPERVIQAIHEWVELFGSPPSATNWNRAALGHDAEKWDLGRWPYVNTVQLVFGSWANAIEAAGYPRPAPKGPPPGTRTEQDYLDTEVLVEEHGTTKAAELLGITPNGVYQRLKHLRGAQPMSTYTATNAIQRDIERTEEKIAALHEQVAERQAYLDALKQAQVAMASVNGAKAHA